MTDTYFVNYYYSKKHKQRYKIKKLLCKDIRKCQNTKKSMEMEAVLLGEIRVDKFGYLNGPYLISIL